MALKLYSVFHVNLLYSSIPESRREEVIKRCLWPLLELALRYRVPIAIDATAATLELISRLDKQWVQSLRETIRSKLVEFVGSGYSQIVAPLVPARVNAWNLEIGRREYKRVLGIVPSLWYINEQAYSAGIVEHYKQLGVRGIVMEWNNPRTLHPEWDDELKYYPQMAVGAKRDRIQLIWNDSISFQKFQRYAHGDIDASDLLTHLLTHLSEKGRCLCLYGNDAEIFDFRPGRFKTEPELDRPIEWARILKLYELLRSDPRLHLVFPSDVLKSPPMARRSYLPLVLESSAQPIPVKKQPKYNVTRWSVTGRNSLYVNTLCHELFRRILRVEQEGLKAREPLEHLKKRLCFLWGSDFRTHITTERWESFLREIEHLLTATASARSSAPRSHTLSLNDLRGTRLSAREDRIKRRPTPSRAAWSETSGDGRFLHVFGPCASVLFNLRRGLSIQSLVFPQLSSKPLAGIIPHGYFKDIALSADWYTGNTVLQRPGHAQVTDLVPIHAELISGSEGGEEWFGCRAEVPTEAGPVRKRFKVYKNWPRVDLDYTFDWKSIPGGSFRTAFLTLVPESYDLSSLFYATHNGGSRFEVFRMEGQTVAHNAPASSVVTASSGLGATEGIVVIGDARKALAVFFEPSVCASMPMVAFHQAAPSFFCRLMFSCGELDESRTGEVPGPLRFVCSVVGVGRRQERNKQDRQKI